MASLALILVFGAVGVLAVRELLETKNEGVSLKAKTKVEKAREVRAEFASAPRSISKAVEFFNSGGDGLGRKNLSIKPVLGEFGQTNIEVFDDNNGGVSIGRFGRSIESLQ